MNITLKCFSHVKYALNSDSVELELPAGATAADLESEIRRRAAGALDGIPLRVSVNRRFVDSAHELAEGDEAALIPPVQGG